VLDAEDSRLSDFAQHVPVGIAVLTPDGAMASGNAAFEQLTGYVTIELRQRKLPELLPPEDRVTLEQLLAELTSGKRQHLQLNTSLCRKNNGFAHVRLYAKAVKGNDEAPMSIMITAEARTPRSVVYTPSSKGGATVTTDVDGRVVITKSHRWLIATAATTVMSLSALIATWQTTQERTAANARELQTLREQLSDVRELELSIVDAVRDLKKD